MLVDLGDTTFQETSEIVDSEEGTLFSQADTRFNLAFAMQTQQRWTPH